MLGIDYLDYQKRGRLTRLSKNIKGTKELIESILDTFSTMKEYYEPEYYLKFMMDNIDNIIKFVKLIGMTRGWCEEIERMETNKKEVDKE